MGDLQTANAITVRPPPGTKFLEDNAQWKNRFEIRSETSNRVYIIAQNKITGRYGCSCPAYLTRRKCKHLIDGCQLSLSQIHGYGQITETKRKRLA